VDTTQTMHGRSSAVILVVRANPDPSSVGGRGTVWEALSPRNGKVVWTKVFSDQCSPRAAVADDFVVVSGCENAPDVVADILDAQTGEARRSVTLSTLGVNSADVKPSIGAVISTTSAVNSH
jgi:hypothetical protein